MKAVIFERFGPPSVLQYRVVSEPEFSKDQVLIQVKACSVNPVDYKIRRGSLKMISGKKFPKAVGSDFSGVVKAVGEDVKTFKPGDEVYGSLNTVVGGACSEMVVATENMISLKPEGLGFAEAAGLPIAALTALESLRDLGGLKAKQHVLINGCTGGVGSMAVQIAKYYGAIVTGVCRTENVTLAKKLGVDEVIDYKKDDLWGSTHSFDIFFDVAGTGSYANAKKLLKPQGTYISTLPGLQSVLLWPLLNMLSSKKAKAILLKKQQDDWQVLNEMIDRGGLKVIVDKIFPIDQIEAAHEYAESGRVRGKVAISVGE
ncbi:NAD(P)-dependent alcohol dehydrogenase [Fulvivirgaceae bacterium BMA12]|uniref:NAD(P)-dependent alcohol dehydrogenase n=1 Tax=Agaribacillus aureus TaxID=3051825 RepID=A0ABT8LDV5_9BACT|nr:NAD(P)-dependent alcohol dehydrogenase [Fulvivirgaceae bacterium BMA12]